ncbi:MAG: response regulator [SAR202 cluster bacterium]|nr:response regulator [SAR202 cluster bacterium]
MDIFKILLIEDNPGDARFIREMLSQGLGANHRVKWAQKLGDGLTLLANETFDVLLLDLSLPDSHGLMTLEQIHPSYPNLPVVVLTGLDDEKKGLESIHKGAEDYLVKGKTESQLLVKSIRYAIERRRTAEALLVKEQENTRLEILRQTAVAMAHHAQNAITPV